MSDDATNAELPNNSDEECSVEADREMSVDEPFDNEIEQAYLRALQANEAIEWELDQSRPTEMDQAADVDLAIGNAIDESDDELPELDDDNTALEDAESDEEEATEETPERSHRINEKQVIEAALFVGGMPLTTKKLRQLLQADNALDVVERSVDALNQQYLNEGRPYEIVLGEGGYRLVLRSEFESIRNRVFGHGPKDVKLSQEVLEILSLVAYRQPVSKPQLEKAGKSNPAGPLRQLLRRELVEIERGDGGRKDIKYRTTDRFLSVFGLSTLDELPQASDFEFK